MELLVVVDERLELVEGDPAVAAGIGLDLVVHGDDVEAVQQLPLVVVDPLDLNVEDGAGVDLDAELQLLQLVEADNPLVDDLVGDQVGGLAEEEGDAAGLVLELLGEVLVAVLEEGGLDDPLGGVVAAERRGS